APYAQTSARWRVLRALDDGPGSGADIARRMGLARQSVQRTADLLEAEGGVAYFGNPAHPRAKPVTLTSKGRAAIRGLTGRQIEWANRIARRLNEGHLQQSVRTLQDIRHAVALVEASGRRSEPSNQRRSR